MNIILYLIIGVVVVIGFYFLMKNNAIAKHENVVRVFADIDVIFIQRNDQVYQQLNAVYQALSTESELAQNVAKYRSGINEYTNMSMNEKINFNASLGAFITHGLRQEAYPSLDSIKTLIPNVISTWNKVETELKNKRLAYNRSATSFNVGLHQFPSSIFFKKARMILSEDGTTEPFALIKATEAEKQSIKIPEANWGGVGQAK